MAGRNDRSQSANFGQLIRILRRTISEICGHSSEVRQQERREPLIRGRLTLPSPRCQPVRLGSGGGRNKLPIFLLTALAALAEFIVWATPAGADGRGYNISLAKSYGRQTPQQQDRQLCAN